MLTFQTLILEQETSASQVTAPLGVILPDDASDISLPEEMITPNAEQPRADTAPEIANVQEKHMVNETMQQDLDIRTAALSHTAFPKAGTGERDDTMSSTFPEELPLAGRETLTQAAAQLEVMIPDDALVALLPSGIIPLNGESHGASVITDAALAAAMVPTELSPTVPHARWPIKHIDALSSAVLPTTVVIPPEVDSAPDDAQPTAAVPPEVDSTPDDSHPTTTEIGSSAQPATTP